jgi:hypothetical protein
LGVLPPLWSSAAMKPDGALLARGEGVGDGLESDDPGTVHHVRPALVRDRRVTGREHVLHPVGQRPVDERDHEAVVRLDYADGGAVGRAGPAAPVAHDRGVGTGGSGRGQLPGVEQRAVEDALNPHDLRLLVAHAQQPRAAERGQSQRQNPAYGQPTSSHGDDSGCLDATTPGSRSTSAAGLASRSSLGRSSPVRSSSSSVGMIPTGSPATGDLAVASAASATAAGAGSRGSPGHRKCPSSGSRWNQLTWAKIGCSFAACRRCLEPVSGVRALGVGHERPHRHRVVAQLALDLPSAANGRLGTQGQAVVHALGQVGDGADQRLAVAGATAEDDASIFTPSGSVVVGRDVGDVGQRRGEAAVRVCPRVLALVRRARR